MDPKDRSLIKKQLLFSAKDIDEEQHIIRGVFSTAGEDRHGEIVDQNGWQLKEYMDNPVILFAHDHYTPAVGSAIELDKDGSGNLAGAIKFAVDTSELAMTLWKLYSQKVMRAFSVGFMNTKMEIDPQDDTIILRENVLFEISCVNVPANAMALAKSMGIDTDPLEKFLQQQVQKEVKITEGDIDKITDQVARKLNTDRSRADMPGKTTKKRAETPTGRGHRYSVRSINHNLRHLLKKKKRAQRFIIKP